MTSLKDQMEQTQQHYMRRNALIESAYVGMPVDEIIESQREAITETTYQALQEAARKQIGLHSDVKAHFGAPLSSLQREDDLYMMLGLVEKLIERKVADIDLGGGGLFRFKGQEVLLGTAPIRRFNALVSKAKWPGQFVVLIDDEVPIAITKIARSLSELVIEANSGVELVDDSRAVANNWSRRAFEGIASVLLSMATRGHSQESVVLDLSPEFQKNFVSLGTASLQFVLFHELAHIDLGHLTNASASFRALSDDEVVEWTTDQQHEFEADKWALTLFSRSMDKQQAKLAGLGFSLPLAVFAAIDLLLLIICAPDPAALNSDQTAYLGPTHPSPMHRLARLRSLLLAVKGADFLSGYDYGVETLITIAQRAGRMVREAKAFEGFTIHPRWQPNIRAMGHVVPPAR